MKVTLHVANGTVTATVFKTVCCGVPSWSYTLDGETAVIGCWDTAQEAVNGFIDSTFAP